jgi:F-type H+-transporting ATPase subunit beta
MEGRTVALDAALDGCEAILNDEFSDDPEKILYMIGDIEEARRRRKKAETAEKEEGKA